jgi:hypothetical protein
VKFTTRVQDAPERSIEGNKFPRKQQFCDHLHVVIVLADGVPVGQESFYYRGWRWWLGDFFVAEAHRGGEATRLLRVATYQAAAEHTDELWSQVEYSVATPEKVTNEPLKRELGIAVEVSRKMQGAAQYRYDLSVFRRPAAR